MRKIILLLLCIVLACSLSACGGKTAASQADETEEEIIFTEFEWPISEVAAILPEPSSNLGYIYWSEDYGFVMYVSETTLDEFAAYAEACEDCGFTLEPQKGDTYFYVWNEAGYDLALKYMDGDVMFIRVDSPDSTIGQMHREAAGETDEDASTEAVEDIPQTEQPTEEAAETEQPDTPDEPEYNEEEAEASSVYYSTNSLDKAKDGNSGVFSYRHDDQNYDTYWIIDFDEGCAYWFTYGNDNGVCDRVQIDYGDLNEYIVVTYHDGDDSWQYGLHFKRKRQPTNLIQQEEDGTTHEFSATDLSEAMEIMSTMTIVDY